MLRFLSYKPKTAFYPYVLFLAVAAILVGWPGHRTHFFKLDTPKMIVAKFGLFWPSSFRGEDVCKRYLKFTKNG